MKHNSIASAIESVLEHILQGRLPIHLLSKPTDGSWGEISNFRQCIYNTVSAINLPFDDHHHDAITVVPGAPKGYFLCVSHFHFSQLSHFAFLQWMSYYYIRTFNCVIIIIVIIPRR